MMWLVGWLVGLLHAILKDVVAIDHRKHLVLWIYTCNYNAFPLWIYNYIHHTALQRGKIDKNRLFPANYFFFTRTSKFYIPPVINAVLKVGNIFIFIFFGRGVVVTKAILPSDRECDEFLGSWCFSGLFQNGGEKSKHLLRHIISQYLYTFEFFMIGKKLILLIMINTIFINPMTDHQLIILWQHDLP